MNIIEIELETGHLWGLYMSLKKTVEDSHKDIAGSRTKNRLTIQISYAVQLIMEFYSMEFLVFMDYIEDVVVIKDPENPLGSSIHLYQVKTKTTDKQYKLNAIIQDKWFQKLYENALPYNGYLDEAALVCNTDIISGSSTVFKNIKNNLSDIKKDPNVRKILLAIAKDLKVDESEVDLSKYYFIRSYLTIKGHKDEVEHQFESFLQKKEPSLQLATARAIYKTLYDELDRKFNAEIDEDCSNFSEIVENKGLCSKEIKEIISTGLAIQLPDSDKLFSLFSITSIKDIKAFNNRYSQIKMDLYSEKDLLIQTKKTIRNILNEIIDNGENQFSKLLESGYKECINRDCIPSCYSEEYYLKMLIMLLAYKMCYGGNET